METNDKNYSRRFDTVEAGGWMMWDIDDLLYGYLKLRATFNPAAQELYFTTKTWNKTATKQEIKKLCGIERKRERDTHFNKLVNAGLIELRGAGTKEERYVFVDDEINYKLVPLDLLEYFLNTASSGVIQVYIYLLDKYEWKKKMGGTYFFTKKEIALALGYSESVAQKKINRINDILECLIRQGIVKFEEVGVKTVNGKPTIRQKLVFVARSKEELDPVELPK